MNGFRERLWKALNLAGVHHLFRHINKDRVTILTYHGVVEGSQPYSYWTLLALEKFRRQLLYLKKYYNILPLPEVAEKLLHGEPLPPYTAVITFDDGFRNNYTTAFPVLQREGLPATIFLATGHMDTNELFWADKLFVIFRETERTELDLDRLALGRYRFETREERQKMARSLLDRLKRLPVEQKNKAMKAIVRELGWPHEPPAYLKDFLPLTWQQVSEMHDSGLIQFGGHTVHHEILSRLEPEAMRAEIVDCCKEIKERLELDKITFSYPNGTREDFGEVNKVVLKEIGIPCALSTIEQLNRRDEDLYELRRIGVGADLTPSRFRLLCSGFIPWLKFNLRREPASESYSQTTA